MKPFLDGRLSAESAQGLEALQPVVSISSLQTYPEWTCSPGTRKHVLRVQPRLPSPLRASLPALSFLGILDPPLTSSWYMQTWMSSSCPAVPMENRG